MGFFSFLQTKDINSGVISFLSTEGAVLLDVVHGRNIPRGILREAKIFPYKA